MKKLLVAVCFVLSLAGCSMLQSTEGVIRSAEVAGTVANLEPMFDHTVTKITENWSQFTPEERLVLESSYRKLLSVRDTIEKHVENQDLDEVILDLADADLIYAGMKDAYVNSRNIVFSKLNTFSYEDQVQLARLDTRMKNLDYSITLMKEEAATKDITPEILTILQRTAEIIQVYRMAKDPLGLTYSDRESE